MITLEGNRLMFQFPEVHAAAVCSIDFQRTLRIPDDGKNYPLPPGLGCFPLRHLDDYARQLPEGWLARGGVIMPMHQAEAMWLNFNCGARYDGYPFAIKVATGKINAVTGEPWDARLNQDPQDYLVVPEQPWLDGYCIGKGVIRQFIAMPLGEGYSAEEQITGVAEHGGLQVVLYPMKAERYEALMRERRMAFEEHMPSALICEEKAMGLAPSGRMRQEVYRDLYGLEAWDQRHSSRCFVAIANAAVWQSVTGEQPPTVPPAAADYTRAGLPWFEYYGCDREALAGTKTLHGLSSVAKMADDKVAHPLPENESVEIRNIVGLRKAGSNQVREMSS